MKAFLLSAATSMLCASGLFAQNMWSNNLPPDYSWEIGVNAGWSTFTRPNGPANVYQGTRTQTVHDYSVRGSYFINEHWMLNLDLGDRKWKSFGDWQIQDDQGHALGKREITFLVADHAINEAVGINYVIPFYTKYHTYNKANLYFGASFGLMQTANDGSINYSNYNAAPDSLLRYASAYHYNRGDGYMVGIQAGYTWYVMPRLGINIDLSVRYAHINTIDMHYGEENSHFNTVYFPETIGLRWRF